MFIMNMNNFHIELFQLKCVILDYRYSKGPIQNVPTVLPREKIGQSVGMHDYL